jgi:hypothetical protein
MIRFEISSYELVRDSRGKSSRSPPLTGIKDAIGDVIQVIDVSREPWHLLLVKNQRVSVGRVGG